MEKTKNAQIRQLAIKILISAGLAGAAWFLLGMDSIVFFIWWLAIWMIGSTFMPLTSIIFKSFDDRGWMFSKVIGVAVCGYVTWLLVTTGIIPFTTLTCMIVTLVCMAGNLWLALRQRRKDVEILPENQGDLIFKEEVIFFIAFLLWTYVVGFRPAAYGTEKFMDFGFMQSMMKSTTLPAIDMWYSQEPINYYYGGQYFAVFLTKLTTTSVELTYNVMRTLIAAVAFVFPFALVRQMLRDRMRDEERRHPEGIATLGGLLAGGAVSLSGNMHYVIYGLIVPAIEKWKGIEETTHYFFSNSTRYIGHNPDTGDRTIHEYPSYSFVLGDLHAHVVNVFFVLVVIAILYAWLRNNKGKSWLQPAVLICGGFLGIFQFTNTWDFAIYYVVICGTLFFGNLSRYSKDMKQGLKWSVIQWIEVIAIAFILALPFNLTFDSGMAQGVALAQNHSPIYRYCVLWALPLLICLAYLISYLSKMRKVRFGKFLEKSVPADMYTAIMALCAMGLIAIPEIVYVRDIYEETSARCNTMFKLTYQAYILFALCMSYILVRFITAHKRRVMQTFGIVMTFVLLTTFGYTWRSLKDFMGNVLDRSEYQTLDATAFLEGSFALDAPAIRWLNENVEGRPVVLEANGDSYSDYERVSAMTGLPTVLGWYVHQWLWRNDTADLNEKSAEIEAIYTSEDEEMMRDLLEKYNVSYIFIGEREREKYLDINEELLRSMGEVVFDGEAVIVQVK